MGELAPVQRFEVPSHSSGNSAEQTEVMKNGHPDNAALSDEVSYFFTTTVYASGVKFFAV